MNGSPTSIKFMIWVAWRALRTKQRKAGLSFMTLVSVLGVCIGVAALIIVLSVMGGFEKDLTDKMLKGQPHLEIMSKNSAAGFSLIEYPVANFVKSYPEASKIEPYIKSDVVIKNGNHLSSATIFGIDPDKGGKLWGFGQASMSGSFESLNEKHAPIISHDENPSEWPGIILGEGLAIQLGADVGDEIVVVSPQGATQVSSVMSGGTLTRHFVLVGTFRTEMFNYDSRWAVMNLTEARKFMTDYDPSLDEEQYVSGIAINFKNPHIISQVSGRIDQFKDLDDNSWQDTNKALLFALKLEKFTMGAILMLIVVVAAFSISGTMMMNVFHRRSQVALLRSLGMSKVGVARLFLVHGLTISTVGILLGLIIGLAVCVMIFNFQFINLPQDVYYLKQLPVRFLPYNYIVICVSAWLFGILASVYPAFTAANQQLSEGLRW